MKTDIKHWNNLTKDELYALLQLRTEVFVVEQNCPYQECDGVDKVAYHLLMWQGDILIGTARIIPKPNNKVALGRIVIKKEKRVEGHGKQLMKTSIDFIKSKLEPSLIYMSAQTYLIGFYASFGFKIVGKEYLEDDIPHIRMELEL